MTEELYQEIVVLGQSSAAIYDSDDPLDEPGVPNSLAPGVGSTGMRSRRSGRH